MAADDLTITKDGPSANPWRLTVAIGPSAGNVVHLGSRTKREAQEVLDRVGHLPWSQLVPGIAWWARSAPAADPIVTVSAYELLDLVAQLRQADAKVDAWHRLGLHIDQHSNVTQAQLRAAMERALDPDFTGDPWAASTTEEAPDGP